MPLSMDHGPQRVLLVEDDPDVRAIAILALADLGGLEVTACGTAAAALDQVRAVCPDVVLLDVALPDMDGVTLAGRVRAMGGPTAPAVIFLTARPDRAMGAVSEAQGLIGVLAKPFEPLSLAESVKTLWRHWQATQRGESGDDGADGARKSTREGAGDWGV